MQECHLPHDLPQLSAIGPRIHIHAAPERPRYAMCKFQPGQAIFSGKHRNGCERFSSHRLDAVPFRKPHTAQRVLQTEHQRVHAPIGREHVRPCAEQAHRDVRFPHKAQQRLHLSNGLWKRHPPRRAADAERRMRCERLVFPYFDPGLPCAAHGFVLEVHSHLRNKLTQDIV